MASACGPRLPDLRFYLHTKFRHRLRKLPRSPRRFAQPERNAGRLAVSVLNANRAGVDSQNPPRRVAELENIAGHAFDGKVFVYGSEECLTRLKHYTIIRVVRDRAAGGQRDQPRLCSARPTRCRRAAIERVDPSWQTRSTDPMSMPSSSDAVATSALSSPRFRRFSASSRNLAERLPWCEVTLSTPRRSQRWRVARSASRRVFTKTSVVRCASIKSASRP